MTSRWRFPGRVARGRRGQAGDLEGSRGLARRPARHHRSARCEGSRRRGSCRTRSRSRQQGRLHRPCRDRRCRLLCAAGFGARSRRADPRQLGLLPRSRGADAARAHLQRSLLAGPERAARRARRAHGDRRRRPQALAQLSSRADALGRETQLRTGAGRDRRQAGRRHGPAARADPEAALRGLRGCQARARRARSARPRHSRAQDPAQARRHGRPRRRARAARCAQTDRRVHDPRQCRGRRNARKEVAAADLPRARRADAGEGSCAAGIPEDDRRALCQGRRVAARSCSIAC